MSSEARNVALFINNGLWSDCLRSTPVNCSTNCCHSLRVVFDKLRYGASKTIVGILSQNYCTITSDTVTEGYKNFNHLGAFKFKHMGLNHFHVDQKFSHCCLNTIPQPVGRQSGTSTARYVGPPELQLLSRSQKLMQKLPTAFSYFTCHDRELLSAQQTWHL